MNNTVKRRIQVASFSVRDVSKVHLLTFVGGFVLVMAALILAWCANISARAGVEISSAAKLLADNAAATEIGVKTFAGGGAVQIAASAKAGMDVNSAISALEGVNVIAGTSKRSAAASLLDAWHQYGGQLQDYWSAASGATELSKSMGASLDGYAQILKAISDTGRANSDFKREYESALRLYTYAEAGFAKASLPRVDFDLKVIGAWAETAGLKSQFGFLATAQAQSKVAMAKSISPEQLNRLLTAATDAKSVAQNISQNLATSSLSLYFGLAVIVALVGISLTWYAFTLVMTDVGRRYTRAIQQFRSGEDDLKDLLQVLEEVERGEASSVELSNKSSMYGSVVRVVNAILERMHTAAQRNAQAATSSASVASEALAALSALDGAIQSTAVNMQEVMSQIENSSSNSALITMDAKSTLFSAEEAASHAADARRTSEDTSTRMEVLRQGLQETSKGIKRLGERAQEINSAVEEMETLSEQIGVLALNANLEAERAGEAGAGFRLVAKEVKDLAQRSEESVQKMSNLIMGTQADARAANQAMERSTAQIVSGSNLNVVSQAMLAALGPLADGIHAMSKTIAEASTGEQASFELSIKRIQQAVQAARDVVQRTEEIKSKLSLVISQLQVVEA